MRLVTFFPHPFKMRLDRLAANLVVIDHTYFFTDNLRYPDNKSVSLCACATDVKEQVEFHQGIDRHCAYAFFCAGRCDVFCVISALVKRRVATLPYVLILIWIRHQTITALLL